MRMLNLFCLALMLAFSCSETQKLDGKWKLDGFAPANSSLTENDRTGTALLNLAAAMMPAQIEFSGNDIFFYDKDNNSVTRGKYELQGSKGVFMTETDTNEFTIIEKSDNQMIFMSADSLQIRLSR